jgi:hypothetical protein
MKFAKRAFASYQWSGLSMYGRTEHETLHPETAKYIQLYIAKDLVHPLSLLTSHWPVWHE